MGKPGRRPAARASRLWWTLPASLMACASGCVASFSANSLAGPAPVSEPESYYRHYFLFGTVGHSERDVRDLCPSHRAGRIEARTNLLTLAATLGTLGLYTPQRMHVYCEQRPVQPVPESSAEASR